MSSRAHHFSQDQGTFQREMEMALHCQHHNIITFLGATLEGPPVILMELMVGTGLLCLFFHLLCYAAVLKNLTYYAQYYAHFISLC